MIGFVETACEKITMTCLFQSQSSSQGWLILWFPNWADNLAEWSTVEYFFLLQQKRKLSKGYHNEGALFCALNCLCYSPIIKLFQFLACHTMSYYRYWQKRKMSLAQLWSELGITSKKLNKENLTKEFHK